MLSRAKHRSKKEVAALVRELDPLPSVLAQSDAALGREPNGEPADPGPDPAPPRVSKPQRYKVQFTATEEHVALLEQARDLLSHTEAGRSIAEAGGTRASAGSVTGETGGVGVRTKSDAPRSAATVAMVVPRPVTSRGSGQ